MLSNTLWKIKGWKLWRLSQIKSASSLLEAALPVCSYRCYMRLCVFVWAEIKGPARDKKNVVQIRCLTWNCYQIYVNYFWFIQQTFWLIRETVIHLPTSNKNSGDAVVEVCGVRRCVPRWPSHPVVHLTVHSGPAAWRYVSVWFQCTSAVRAALIHYKETRCEVMEWKVKKKQKNPLYIDFSRSFQHTHTQTEDHCINLKSHQWPYVKPPEGSCIAENRWIISTNQNLWQN